MTVVTLHQLNASLLQRLRHTYDPAAPTEEGAGPLRAAFAAFGRDARQAQIPLEDTMAAAVDAYQQWVDATSGPAHDGTIMLAAGIALAAVSRAYDREDRSCSDRDDAVAQAPRSWLEALHRINRSATANLDLSTRLETSVRVVADTLGADACALSLYDEGTGLLSMRAAVGLNPASVGVVATRPGVGITGVSARDGQIVATSDARHHPAYVFFPTSGEDLYASQVSVPLLIRQGDEPGRLVGVLTLLSVERREFPPDEIAFLETLAGELAISIENARLYSQTDARLQQKIAELGTLQRVSHTIASSLDLNAVLRSIAEQAVQLINVESASIFRRGRKGDAFGPVKIEYRVGQARQAIDELGRDEAVTEVLRTGSAQSVDIEYVDGAGRVFCLPLRSARETLGALCLRMAQGAELSEDQMNLLQAFSDSATLAIENATLYQEALKGYETASALLQEMHHRVRNNLQTVAALLSLQLRKNEDAPWAGHLREAVGRVQAIASIHDLLSDESRLAGTTIDVIARHVAGEAHRTLIPPGMRVVFDIPPSRVKLPSKHATVLALLINELVSNAVRHGFAGRNSGQITITATEEQGTITVRVANDGSQPPPDFDPDKTTGLGMRIIHRLVTSDLGGSFTIEPGHPGAVATITFPRVENGR
jgi:two-component sensor histidine kinase/putative methionine-R-sulfoxide reductase with GAF domain